MVKIRFFVISEDSIVEKETNALTIIRTLNKLIVSSIENFVLPKLAINIGYFGNGGQYNGLIKVIDPKGSTIFEDSFKINIANDNPRHQYSLKVMNILFTMPGEYAVKTEISESGGKVLDSSEQSFDLVVESDFAI